MVLFEAIIAQTRQDTEVRPNAAGRGKAGKLPSSIIVLLLHGVPPHAEGVIHAARKHDDDGGTEGNPLAEEDLLPTPAASDRHGAIHLERPETLSSALAKTASPKYSPQTLSNPWNFAVPVDRLVLFRGVGSPSRCVDSLDLRPGLD